MDVSMLPDSPEFDFIRSVAAEYNVKVRLASLEEGARGYKIEDIIVLNRRILSERRNWTFSHELGHIVLGHSSNPSDSEERAADDFASELLLPARDFIPDSKSLDLAKLKELYPHASWEAIARRCLQYHAAVLTIFDGGEVTLRAASGCINYPSKPSPAERLAVENCQNHRRHYNCVTNGLTLYAYYIDLNPDIIRIILISQPQSGEV